jgi:hypothetical protein
VDSGFSEVSVQSHLKPQEELAAKGGEDFDNRAMIDRGMVTCLRTRRAIRRRDFLFPPFLLQQIIPSSSIITFSVYTCFFSSFQDRSILDQILIGERSRGSRVSSRQAFRLVRLRVLASADWPIDRLEAIAFSSHILLCLPLIRILSCANAAAMQDLHLSLDSSSITSIRNGGPRRCPWP